MKSLVWLSEQSGDDAFRDSASLNEWVLIVKVDQSALFCVFYFNDIKTMVEI